MQSVVTINFFYRRIFFSKSINGWSIQVLLLLLFSRTISNEEFFPPFFFFFYYSLSKTGRIKWHHHGLAVGREVGSGRQKARRASPLSLQRLEREPTADRVYTRVRNKGYNKNTNDGSVFPDDLRTFSQLVVQSLKSMFHHSYIYIYIYVGIITYISYIVPIKKSQNSVYHRIFDLSTKKEKNKLLA